MNNNEKSMQFLLKIISELTLSDRYLVYTNLLCDMKQHEEELLHLSKLANSSDFIKGLLNNKKEDAIRDLSRVIPYLQSRSVDAKCTLLKILPVLFSYVSLHDMAVPEAFKIIDILKVHSAFVADQQLFVQWYVLFKRRKLENEPFAYKNEKCSYNLPKLSVSCPKIGYCEVSLLRAFHRWLRLHRLHKYLYFFANLSYEEILLIDETNVTFYEKKIGLLEMTTGAKNKILREISELRKRPTILRSIISSHYHSPTEIENGMREIKKILRTPIMLNDGFGENIPDLICKALSKVYQEVLDQVGSSEGIIPLYGLLISILKESWNYNIFDVKAKVCFNNWKKVLTETINMNSMTELKIPRYRKPSMKHFHESTFTIDNFIC